MARAAAVKARQKLSQIQSDDDDDNNKEQDDKLSTDEEDSDDEAGGGFIADDDDEQALPQPPQESSSSPQQQEEDQDEQEEDLRDLFQLFISKHKRDTVDQDVDKMHITIADLESVAGKIGDKKSTHQDLQDMISVATNGKSNTQLGYNDFVSLMDRIHHQ